MCRVLQASFVGPIFASSFRFWTQRRHIASFITKTKNKQKIHLTPTNTEDRGFDGCFYQGRQQSLFLQSSFPFFLPNLLQSFMSTFSLLDVISKVPAMSTYAGSTVFIFYCYYSPMALTVTFLQSLSRQC